MDSTFSLLMQGFAVAGTPENLMIALVGCFLGTIVGLLQIGRAHV